MDCNLNSVIFFFSKASVVTDPIYDGCGSKKTCFGFPSDCVETKSCTAVVSCLVEGERYEFDMQAKKSAYVAVGLSQDVTMVRMFTFYIFVINAYVHQTTLLTHCSPRISMLLFIQYIWLLLPCLSMLIYRTKLLMSLYDIITDELSTLH
jgi:hypothetical protein